MMKRALGSSSHSGSGLAGLVWLWGTAPLTCLLGAALLHASTCGAQTTVSQIAAGNQHSLFVKSDGSLWAMGFNYFGQLGDGTGSSQTNQPEMIVSKGVTTVVAAGNHSFFTIGSKLWAMGDNESGQLGDGTTNNIYVPKQITTVIAFGAGDSHSLFTSSSGFYRDLYAMGENGDGELGNGTYNSTNQPARIERDDTLDERETPRLCRGGSQSLTIPGVVRKGATMVLGDVKTLRQIVARWSKERAHSSDLGRAMNTRTEWAGDERRSKVADMDCGARRSPEGPRGFEPLRLPQATGFAGGSMTNMSHIFSLKRLKL